MSTPVATVKPARDVQIGRNRRVVWPVAAPWIVRGGLAEVWSWTGSNRRHPACKAGALPAELQPLETSASEGLVGLGGLEPPTSRLSGARSSQLSYRPLSRRRVHLPLPTDLRLFYAKSFKDR